MVISPLPLREEELDFPAVVELNVGGSHFAASLETLRGGHVRRPGCDIVGDSMLSAMFSGRVPTRRDAEGRFFIDRDGRHFHHILNYLRDGTLPTALSQAQRLEVAREASFYGLEALADHLRAHLQVLSAFESATGRDSGPDGTDCDVFLRPLSATEAAERVLNTCLEEWPEFPEFVRRVLDQLLVAAGVSPELNESSSPVGPTGGYGGESDASPQRWSSHALVFDESCATSLQADTLAAAQIELAHVDAHSKAWRWSERRAGVNTVARVKLLRCHLQRLGYTCRIVPILDKEEVSAYILQVELPIPP